MDWTLFGSAFLSATLLPGSSEALLLVSLREGQAWLPLVLVATAGNLLGSLVTFGMGRAGNLVLHRRWLRCPRRWPGLGRLALGSLRRARAVGSR